MKRKVRRLKIRGKTWRIIYDRPPVNRCSALCDDSIRTIWIRPSQNQTPEEVLISFFHELLHAALPDISEESVEETEAAFVAGVDLLPLLWAGK